MKTEVQQDERHSCGVQMLDDEGRREGERRTNLWVSVVLISIMERAI